MRSAISSASSIRWVISTQVLPRRRTSSVKSARSAFEVTWSSWLKLSSSSTSAGSTQSARASETRWRMPPESSCGYLRIFSSPTILTFSSHSIARLRRVSLSKPRISRPSETFSQAERQGSRRSFWKLTASLPRSALNCA